MMKRFQQKLQLGLALVLTAMVAGLIGCSSEAQFTANAVLMLQKENEADKSIEFSEQRRADIMYSRGSQHQGATASACRLRPVLVSCAR